LSIAEIDELNLGIILDYIYAYDDINSASEANEEYMPKSSIVYATQADFDKF